ncbi:MAG: tetratricopeptide repeat protein, partial [Xanthomonadales bacterium]|nr:tetratricopeptide repeat protein [Xanthomonadales bacterium]
MDLPPPNDPVDAALRRARQLAGAGRWPEIIDALRPFETVAERAPEVWRWLGLAWLRTGQPDRAVAAFRARADLADEPQARIDLAAALIDAGDPHDALALLEALAADQRTPESDFNLARARKALGRTGAAEAPLERVVAALPQHVGAWLMLGDVRKALGDAEGAAAAYRSAIRQAPDRAAPWWAFSNLKAVGFNDEEREELGRRAAAAAPPEAPMFAFAQARADEDRGDIDAAFAHYAAGNAAMRARRPWDHARYREWLRRITNAQKAVGVPPLPQPRGR